MIHKITEMMERGETEESMPPLAIFPEGTVCNGKGIMQFKQGAFKDLAPIKIIAIKLSYDRFMPYADEMNPEY